MSVARHPHGATARGFVLPFVIVTVAAAGVLAMAFVTTALRAARTGALANRADQAHAAANEAMAAVLAAWNRDSLWTWAPGTIISRDLITRSGTRVYVHWVRTAPLVAWLRVRAERSTGRAFDAGRREYVRVVHVAPPALPVPAAVTTTGPLYGADGTILSGFDLTLPDSPCGTVRDTLSVVPAVAASILPEPAGHWDGAMPSMTVSPAAAALIESAARDLAGALPAIVRDSGRAPIPGATAEAGEAPRWRALSLSGSPLHVAAGAPFHGLLLLRGPLVVRGRLDVTGLVLVNGEVDFREAALRIQGALVVADPSRHGTHLGATSRILYDRCAVQLALATVSRPISRPFSLWQRLVD